MKLATPSHESTADPLEQQAADRLASMRMLAAGLGHDVGNILPVVRLHLDSLGHMNLPDPALVDIQAIDEACKYLANLCRGLHLFLDPPSALPSADQTDLAAWWAEVAPFMRNAVAPPIKLVIVPFLAPFPVAISAHALTQVVYNLVQNAATAMAGRPSGRISISITGADAGANMVLAVTDDGPGMTDEVRRRCMEPYFTTKPPGTSSGLGLALVRDAVRHAGGSITLHSRLGEGTTFLLKLRVCRPTSAVLAVRAAVPADEIANSLQFRRLV